MNTISSSFTTCCHWCGVPLGNASKVTYLNGNLAVCDLCLIKAGKEGENLWQIVQPIHPSMAGAGGVR